MPMDEGERAFRTAVGGLTRAVRLAQPDEKAAARLAPLLQEVEILAALGPDAPLDRLMASAHRAVHAYRPVCVDADAPAERGDGPVFIAWSRLHETLHRIDKTGPRTG
ncbi:MAG TPA: hypothetical protein VE198_14710 [Actinoallomurus sp.]|nr:hypothetical protein [Actinoallomurus sp.]